MNDLEQNFKYEVNCYTEKSMDTKFPENTYMCKTLEEVTETIKNCSRQIAGIEKIEIFILRKEQ